ncbi:hypothetical protein [Hymenobacter cellulosivorans]|uniref:DUF4968 domain-containing protein n=1 Tax=Hymenobacter cellulosivorans TaxID=2932249 RepID=A0ABY4F514_9BACT|nr:hypothetical protein [Hymenobacter cellulosivorans]UOQ51757.1 hypothetical protein MUN80_18575 [Hymenobacter cellulosivorans]
MLLFLCVNALLQTLAGDPAITVHLSRYGKPQTVDKIVFMSKDEVVTLEQRNNSVFIIPARLLTKRFTISFSSRNHVITFEHVPIRYNPGYLVWDVIVEKKPFSEEYGYLANRTTKKILVLDQNTGGIITYP